MYQMKEQDKAPEKQLSEVEIGNLPKTALKAVIIIKVGLHWWPSG